MENRNTDSAFLMMSERLSKVKAQKTYQEGYSMAIDIISKEFQYELNNHRKLMYEFANGVITAQLELNEKCKTCLDGANFKNCEKCSIGKAKDTLSKLKGDAKIIVKYEKPEIIGTDGKVNKCSGGLSFTFKPVSSAASESIAQKSLENCIEGISDMILNHCAECELGDSKQECDGCMLRKIKRKIISTAADEEGDENDK